MINQQQLMQALQQLQQKNNQNTPIQAAPPLQAPAAQDMQSGQKGPSLLGFLGGLGDTHNAQGGIDPSFLSRMNQGIMKQVGDGNGTQPFPWQPQPAGQQMGQNAGGGIMKLLSFFGG